MNRLVINWPLADLWYVCLHHCMGHTHVWHKSSTGSIAGSVMSAVSNSSSVFSVGGGGGKRSKASRERVHVVLCGGHHQIITCIVNRLRILANSAALPVVNLLHSQPSWDYSRFWHKSSFFIVIGRPGLTVSCNFWTLKTVNQSSTTCLIHKNDITQIFCREQEWTQTCTETGGLCPKFQVLYMCACQREREHKREKRD